MWFCIQEEPEVFKTWNEFWLIFISKLPIWVWLEKRNCLYNVVYFHNLYGFTRRYCIWTSHLCTFILFLYSASTYEYTLRAQAVVAERFHISQNGNGVKYKNSHCIKFSGFVRFMLVLVFSWLRLKDNLKCTI